MNIMERMIDETKPVVQSVRVPVEVIRKNFIVSWKELTGQKEPEATPLEEAEDEDCSLQVDEAGKQEINKKEKKSLRLPKFEDYDVDDPFIDDSEVTVMYESVFDLMMNGGGREAEQLEDIDDLEIRESSTKTQKRRPNIKDFYVYRGPVEVEVIEKEFDEPKRKKKRKKSQKMQRRTGDSKKSKVEQQDGTTENAKKRAKHPESLKASFKSKKSSREQKSRDKTKQVSLTERLQQLEAEIEAKEGKEDVLMDALETDERTNVRKFYDIEKEVVRLETLDAKDQLLKAVAQVSAFDPQKFPTALRTPLERYVLCCLKRDAEALKTEVLEEISEKVPYSAAALRKLLVKKIFPLLIESYSQVRPEIIRKRVRDEIDTILQAESNEAEGEATEGAQKTRKRKWSEPLKEYVFEYLKCASEKSLLLRAVRLNSVDENPANPPTKPKVPASLSETALRRTAYRELMACWPEDRWTMQTSELSRECSFWKKRYERQLLSQHGVDIEQFLVVVEKKPAASAEPNAAESGAAQADPADPARQHNSSMVIFDDND